MAVTLKLIKDLSTFQKCPLLFLTISTDLTCVVMCGVLHRLRQCCCHAYLLTSALKKEDSDLDSLSLELAMGALTLAQECDEVDHPTTTKPVSRHFWGQQ